MPKHHFLTHKLQEFDFIKGWKIVFYDEFKSLFTKDLGEELDSELEDLLGIYLSIPRAQRLQLIYKATPFLFAFFPKEKLIRVASSRLGNELFLLQQVEKESLNENLGELFYTEEYDACKNHIEAIARMDPKTFPSVYELETTRYGLRDLINSSEELNSTYRRAQNYIDRLMKDLNSYRPSWFEKISDYGLGLTAQYALLRIHLLKFLAILPSLDHDVKGIEVKRIFLEALRRLIADSAKARRLKLKGQERALPSGLILNFKFLQGLAKIIPAKILTPSMRWAVRFMATRFIAGENIESAEASFKPLFNSGRDVTLDQLGELVVSEKEADQYCDEVIKLIRGFSQHIPKGEVNKAGINRAHVSIKVSALCSDFRPESFELTYSLVAPRLKRILLCAQKHDVFINIDAEHYHYRDVVFEVYQKLLLETVELQDFKATGIVLQAYLRDASRHLDDIIALANKRGICMPIRLVKGAYWDAETVEADAHNQVAPEFLNKEETDLNFRQMVEKIYQHKDDVKLCLASHNFSDHCFAEALKDELYPEVGEIEHQCLHMTYEALSYALAQQGWATRNYVPIGSLLVGMAYLVRRIMENSSQVGVLTIMRSHKKAQELSSPEAVHHEKIEAGSLERDLTQSHLSEKFFNVTPVRLYKNHERIWMEKALQEFKNKSLGRTYSNPHQLSGKIQSVVSSSNPGIVVGEITFAQDKDVQALLETLDQEFQQGEWSSSGPRGFILRSNTIIKAAHLMLIKRTELSALICYEAGKAIPEALGDVDEAIDFLHFYAREEVRLHRHGELIKPRGPCAVICPWNFPLAIPCGMSASNLLAGNPVVLKSAEQTPLISQAYVNLMHEAGVPKNVLIHMPGLGEEVGPLLTDSKLMAGIVFTGSKQVGMMIAEKASKRVYENKRYKLSYPVKVITEMGGKNAVIVTGSAELDETVAGILSSAFAHAGQKCSAASRVLVHRPVIERLKERLSQAVLDLHVGSAFEFSTAVNPVISKEDKERVQKIAQECREEVRLHGGEVVVDRTTEELPGFCVGPSIFEISKTRSLHPESYAMKEVFGPMVHLIPFDSLDEALEIYNGTQYALTGGVFSQSQDEIDYLSARMESGNIYVNRNITGARVGIEPFGGFKLSGTGPKAGGRSYLRAFHVSENLEVLDLSSIPDKADGSKASDYQFDLARPSGLTSIGRAQRLVKALEVFYVRYEQLFQSVDGDHKLVLEKFKKWIAKNMIDFVELEHNNRKIPGQISVNNHHLFQEHALVLSYSPRPSFVTFLQFMSAVAMGVGVTVVARTQASYQWWSQAVEILNLNGFSRENIDVYFATEARTQEALSEPLLSTVIYDGSREGLEQVLEEVYQHLPKAQRMRRLMTSFDSADIRDFKRFCEHHIWVRSFAVNTMRHGAPLSLELVS